MNIADILIVLLIGLFTFIGIKSGLVRMLIRFAALFLSLFIAFVAYPVFSDMIVESGVTEGISEKISTEYVTPYIDDLVSENIDSENGILSVVADDIDLQSENAAELVSDKITALFINVLAFLIILVLCRLAFAILSRLLLGISEFPILRQINLVAGGVIGFIQGILVCLLIVSATTIIAPMNDNVKMLDNEIQNSQIAVQFYNNNFILSILSTNN